MALKCTSCGGTIVYNITQEKLECEYCKTTFDVNELGTDHSGHNVTESMNGITMDTYQCRNCGAMLSAPEEQTVAYCMYCRSEVTLLQKSEEMERPKRIIPFKITKEKAKELYKKQLQNSLFAPDDFKDAEFVEGFRGIYIPYWTSEYKIDKATVTFKGHEYTTEGLYDITRYYDYTVDVGGDVGAGCYDASAAFDDTIAAEIAPYNLNQSVPFAEGYLAGFYSDKATVSADIYREQMEKAVLKNIRQEMEKATKQVFTSDKEIKDAVHWKRKKEEALLFPVWFLTWRKRDRVAYAVMNGQTGKMTMDLPVDFRKMFKYVGIATAVLFLLTSLFAGFILPLNIAIYASAMLFFASGLLRRELRKIGHMENHTYDYGYQEVKKPKKKWKKHAFGGFLSVAAWIIVILFLWNSKEGVTVTYVCFFYIVMFLMQIVMAIRQMMTLHYVKNKTAILPILFGVFVQLAGVWIADVSRQADYWYYGLASFCFVGIILCLLTNIYYLNYLTTRPVPNFFTREGANNRYE